MKFKCGRRGIEITPENDQDIAYIEDTLGVKDKSCDLRVYRDNLAGSSELYKLKTGMPRRTEHPRDHVGVWLPTIEGKAVLEELLSHGWVGLSVKMIREQIEAIEKAAKE